jgi:hypothetical protein
VRELRERLISAAPDLRAQAIALVDSPRWPRDLDCSRAGVAFRGQTPSGRELDAALRTLFRAVRSGWRDGRALSMYPTPPLAYFLGCAASPRCKPHLRALARELFGAGVDGARPYRDGPAGGALFTRFMLAGFASYRALESAGVETFECYPDLEFRLWSRAPLPSKREGARALATRRKVNAALRRRLGIGKLPPAGSLDEADAEVLVLSVAAAAMESGLFVLRAAGEGSFLVAMRRRDTVRMAAIRQFDSGARLSPLLFSRVAAARRIPTPSSGRLPP